MEISKKNKDDTAESVLSEYEYRSVPSLSLCKQEDFSSINPDTNNAMRIYRKLRKSRILARTLSAIATKKGIEIEDLLEEILIDYFSERE